MKKNMSFTVKKLFVLLISMCCFTTINISNSYANSSDAKSSQPAPQSLDKIVVIINDDVITQSELNRALALVKIQIAQAQAPQPPDDILRKQVIDQLINKKLQLQIAKQANISVSEADLNKTIANIAKQNNFSVQELYQRLNSDGMSTTDYRAELREQLTLQKLQQQELAGRITISPEEVDRFIRSQAWQNNNLKEYHLEDILIPVADTPSPEDIAAAKKHADAILAQLNQGKSFQEVAQAESKDAHALQGGDLGWRKLPEIPSAFAERVTQMQANQIVGPIQTSNGFHIIRLVAVRNVDAKQNKPDRKQIENLLLQQKYEEAIQIWISKLRAQAFIVIDPK